MTTKNPQKTTTIYGSRAVFEAIASGKKIEKVWLLKSNQSTQFKELQKLLHQHNINVSYVPKERLERFDQKNHQGVVAQMAIVATVEFETLVEHIEDKKNPLFLLLDGVTDVRNFGAILRTAAAVGVDGVIIPSSGSAPLNGDVVKTSAGGIFKVSIAKVNHLKDVIYQLQQLDFSLLAITEKTKTSIYDNDYKGPIAIILGSEVKGISKGILKIVKQQVKIPMAETTDSLNVSVAAAVALYEIVRQRL